MSGDIGKGEIILPFERSLKVTWAAHMNIFFLSKISSPKNPLKPSWIFSVTTVDPPAPLTLADNSVAVCWARTDSSLAALAENSVALARRKTCLEWRGNLSRCPIGVWFLVVPSDAFRMIKWPFSKVKWPSTTGSTDHFESPLAQPGSPAVELDSIDRWLRLSGLGFDYN